MLAGITNPYKGGRNRHENGPLILEGIVFLAADRSNQRQVCILDCRLCIQTKRGEHNPDRAHRAIGNCAERVCLTIGDL